MKRIFNFKNGNVNGNGNEFARAVTTSKKSKRNFCYQKQKNFALQKEKKPTKKYNQKRHQTKKDRRRSARSGRDGLTRALS